MYVQLFSEAGNLNLSLHLHPCFVYASSKGSGKSVHLHRLIWAFVALQCDNFQNLMCWLIWFENVFHFKFYMAV